VPPDDVAWLRSPQFARQVGVAQLLHYAEVDSTMDEVHRLARAGAPAGTVVLADAQRHGRGRAGRAWASAAGDGVWMTLLERPSDPAAVAVLSLRLGLALAPVLAAHAPGVVQVKWPNDLLVAGRKLAGILVEARWRGATLDWVALGVGVNRRVPAAHGGTAVAVRPEVSRAALVAALVPAMRAASQGGGRLTDAECLAWQARDALRGAAIVEPVRGTVVGITASGALRVDGGTGALVEVAQGSVRLAAPPTP
jgi:BirA family biotin operon repressor/biotin-[acetyl-CoA-carboxylase] ligase